MRVPPRALTRDSVPLEALIGADAVLRHRPSTAFRLLRPNWRPMLVVTLALTVSACATRPTGDSPAAGASPTGPTMESPYGEPGDGSPGSSLPSQGASLESARPSAAARGRPPANPRVEVALPAGLPVSQADPNKMVAHFIDVGQGDAALLEFSCGAVLIDTGGETTAEVRGRQRLSDYLTQFFQRRADLAWTLDLVVLSHPHKDHTDGVSMLLNSSPAITIRNVLDNGTTDKGSGIKGQKDLQAHASQTGAGYLGMSESDIRTVAGATSGVIDPLDCRTAGGGVDPEFAVLWGRVDINETWANDGNNDSVVVRLAFGSAILLFTGDLEAEGIESMLESYSADISAFDADVLKVGHHGSHNATTPSLLAAVTPRIAIIQSGDSTLSRDIFSAYAFGHPHRNTINHLLDPTNGVQLSRPSKTVPVGTKGRNPATKAPPQFVSMSMERAIYANGWDGNIAVAITSDGNLDVESGF